MTGNKENDEMPRGIYDRKKAKKNKIKKMGKKLTKKAR